MKGYIIKYHEDFVCVTNNPEKWLEDNNKQRLSDDLEPESLNIFDVEEIELNIYEVEE